MGTKGMSQWDKDENLYHSKISGELGVVSWLQQVIKVTREVLL